MINVAHIKVKKGRTEILKEATFRIEPGKITVVVGKNGAGKSTMLEALTGSNPLSGGSIHWEGEAMEKMSSKTMAIRRAVLSQSVKISFSLRVGELVEMGTYVSDEPLPQIKIDSLIKSALQEVEMQDFIDRDFTTLSGGEQKRVLLAKCIAQLNCCCWSNVNKYLFLDEPTANLDVEQQFKLIELVRKLVRRRNVGVFAVLHDINLAAQFADEILMLRDGRIIKKGSPQDILTPENIKETFDIRAIVTPHPVFGCPHITTLPKHISESSISSFTKKSISYEK
ncbi:MAG: ATP-binding cassette domain-containing protein [Bacteroidota bacterium]